MSHIQKIEFSAGMCFGTCPAFSLELNRIAESIFIAEKFNFNNDSLTQGTFKTLLNESVWNELDEMINSLDIFSLEDNYEMFITDMPLELHFFISKMRDLKKSEIMVWLELMN